MAQVLHLTGPVLVGPDDVRPQAWVVGGRITYAAPAGDHDVTTVAGWVLPGLVDAHSHIGLGPQGAVDDATAEAAGAGRPRRRGAAAARRRLARRHPLGAGARRPAPPRAGRPAHRPHPALHPQLRVGGRARAARRAGAARGPCRRRLGQAGRRLDRPRHRRPLAVLARRRARAGRRRGARGGRPGHGALLRRGVAARPRRRRHRLRRARLRPPARHGRLVRRPGHRHRADAGQHRHLPADRRAGPREVPGLPPAHARPARAAATRRSPPRATPASRSTSARMPVARCRTGWSPPRWPTSRTPGFTTGRGAGCRLLGRPGVARAGRGSRRARRPTSSSTPTTRARTSRRWPPRRSSCCAASPHPA